MAFASGSFREVRVFTANQMCSDYYLFWSAAPTCLLPAALVAGVTGTPLLRADYFSIAFVPHQTVLDGFGYMQVAILSQSLHRMVPSAHAFSRYLELIVPC